MNVHAPSPPACRSIARPSSPISSSAIAHHCTGQVREAEARADDRARADEPGDADAGGEELEDDQREAGDEQEVRDPRRVERVRELLTEVELVEADLWFGCRRRSLPSPITSAVSSVTSLPSTVHRLSVERNDEVADRRLHRVDDVESLGVPWPTADRSTTASTLSVLRPFAACAARTCVARPRRAVGSPVSSKSHGMHRTDARARRDRDDRRAAARAARSRRARRRPTDRSTRRSGPSRRRRPVDELVHVGVDRTGARELDDEQRRVVRSRRSRTTRLDRARRWPGRAGR